MVKELSAEELEASCRKCTEIEVSNMSVLTRVLERMDVDYEVRSETRADIFAKINITQMALALAEENCNIRSIAEKDENLESFFIALTGGDGHA